jgi:SAM-dependent methyltransferase
MDPRVRASYRETLASHGSVAEGVKMSPEGQRDRFAQLMRIGELAGHRVVDVGCGVGDFYAYLREHVQPLDYLGIDVMDEMAQRAAERYPEARFAARDVLTEGLGAEFDYVLLSAVFNDPMDDATAYLLDVVGACLPAARLGLGLNFISARAARQEPEALAYHDPARVLSGCLDLSPYVELHHFYARADVSVFIRPGRETGT